jgi:predicted ATPase
MHLKSIEILNLWNKTPIKVPFDNRVTFLTGINGSGKSSILNILFDTLMAHKQTPATSKNRFWSCAAEFDKLTYRSSIFPLPPSPENKGIGDFFKDTNSDLHDILKLQDIEKLYSTEDESNIKSVRYNDDLKGHIQHTSLSFPSGEFNDKDDATSSVPNVFIFQEDRKSLHNVEKIASIRSSASFLFYKNSIDERFAYIRESFAIYESRIASLLEKAFLNASSSGDKFEIDSDNYTQSVVDQISEKNKVIEKLNKYFSKSGKEISRDEDNKVTLKIIETNTVISWNLLSRGEKTLIYLFLVCLIYNGSLLLLDEPEISLHVLWQRTLISDLSEIADKSQFIVATHSPSLVSEGWVPNCLDIKI